MEIKVFDKVDKVLDKIRDISGITEEDAQD